MKNYSITAQAPGRINIIGEHTDYNDGFVLPAAIQQKTYFKLRENGTLTEVNITATKTKEFFSFDLKKYSPVSEGWRNYVMGVVCELQKINGNIRGFDGEFYSDIPIGSGMSSSAALECSLAYGINALFDLKLKKWQLIMACQRAEHNFVGTKCGIMDQFASMMGKMNQAMFLDCRSLEYQYVPINLNEYRLVLLNTNVSHNLASSQYNTRRAECNKGVEYIKQKYPDVKSLRDVNIEMLLHLKKAMHETLFRRCRHVITENQRVLEAVKALQNNDFKSLGLLMYNSHLSLQNDYEVSCKELNFLVEHTYSLNYVLGSRMMGGGFGGCTINIVKRSYLKQFIDGITVAYQNRFRFNLKPIEIAVGNGAAMTE